VIELIPRGLKYNLIIPGRAEEWFIVQVLGCSNCMPTVRPFFLLHVTCYEGTVHLQKVQNALEACKVTMVQNGLDWF